MKNSFLDRIAELINNAISKKDLSQEEISAPFKEIINIAIQEILLAELKIYQTEYEREIIFIKNWNIIDDIVGNRHKIICKERLDYYCEKIHQIKEQLDSIQK